MNGNRRKPIVALLAACVLLAWFLVWIRGHPSVVPADGTARVSPSQHDEEPAAPTLLVAGGDTASRVAAEDAREDEAPPQPAISAVLSVLVVSRSTRAPLESIRVYARAEGEAEGSPIEDVEGARGGIGRGPITGTDGRVELDLPDSTRIRLSTYAPWADASSTTLDVGAMQPGERRQIVVELVTEADLRFRGIVLTRADRRPIAGAIVRVQYPGPAPSLPAGDATSDAEGRFEVQIASWRAPHLRIEASNFGIALVEPQPGHETRATEVTVLLEPAATLKLHLTIVGDLGIAEARFQAGTEGRHVAQPDGVSLGTSLRLPDPSWSAETDFQGRCTLDGLPPGAPLSLEASQSGHVLRRETGALTLRPGEVREIEWRIGAGCRLTGRVVDQANVPVADRELWVLRPESTLSEFLNAYAERRVAKRTMTDRDGAYIVKDLAPGRWCIGPAPARPYPRPLSESAIAPLADFVEIPEGAQEIRRDLVLHRGLYIRGRVVDPAGAPVPYAAVLGSSSEITLHDSVGALEDGTFEFGPLVPGRYVLSAAAAAGFGDSDRVEASSGDEGVILRLEREAVLSGTVVDARTGAACSARLTVTSPEAKTPMMMLAETKPDGTFRIEGLKNGAYDVAAHTEDVRVGFVRGVQASGDADPIGIEVRVTPGAKLRIRYEGTAKYGTFHVRSDGLVVGVDSLENGTSKAQGAPAGRVSVRFTLWDPTRTQERTLDLAAGEEREVAFTDGD